MTAPVGVLVMAYGTASGPDDIERYYTDIRGGRAPSSEHLTELRDRYAAIGNVFPLLDTTREQAEGLVDRLQDGETRFRAFLGMKHRHRSSRRRSPRCAIRVWSGPSGS